MCRHRNLLPKYQQVTGVPPNTTTRHLNDFMKKGILEHIWRFGSIIRKEADELLFPKLPSILDEKQKKNKVNRLLAVV